MESIEEILNTLILNSISLDQGYSIGTLDSDDLEEGTGYGELGIYECGHSDGTGMIDMSFYGNSDDSVPTVGIGTDWRDDSGNGVGKGCTLARGYLDGSGDAFLWTY